ncbi:DUF2254 family protein [Flavobacterium sp. RHBU_3]|uniref:DUF2254 family protein n=1 Tax=Flavobacterium sp. RHBU_3 TaxID=3391184 RepID=UPI0039850ED7
MGQDTVNHKISQWLEHRVKYIGTLMGNAFAIIISLVLLTIDYFTDISRLADENIIYDRLTGIASLMVSIVIGISLTSFSVIFVVMQLASSQFSPRILRHFLANDVRIQQYIGLFIGTVGLCVMPMAASALFHGRPFPITMGVGILLALYCLVWSYPRLITYLSVNMNVAAIADKIKEDIVNEINALYSKNWQPGQPMLYAPLKPHAQSHLVNIKSCLKSGYLEHINYEKLNKLVTRFVDSHSWADGIFVYQKPVVGEFVMQGATTLLTIETKTPLTLQQETILQAAFEEIADSVFSVNTFRSYTQDINFGVRKLVDIAIKAISPAVNDPTTCLNCIDQLGDIAFNLQKKLFPSDEAQKLEGRNIIANEFNFDLLIDFCFDQIFEWGKEDPTVVRRLLHTLALLAENAENPYNLMVLIRQVRDMELQKIYTEQNIAERHIKISGEKLVGISNSLHHFEDVAKKRIDYLEKAGRLQHSSITGHPEIEAREKEAIHYLTVFAGR